MSASKSVFDHSIEDEVERILALSDEEVLAEVRAEGEDPTAIANEMRAAFERAFAAYMQRQAKPGRT